MISWNNWLWGSGLALQLVLVGLLVRSGTVRRLPLFTSLIGFYVLRSVLLFGAFGHVRREAYSMSYEALSFLDLGLQVLVAWELFCGGRSNANARVEMQPWAGSKLGRVAVFLALFVLSAGLAWGISLWIRANPRSPVDRGVLLSSILMLAVAAACLPRRGYGTFVPVRRVLEGFSVLAMTSIAAQIGRTVTAEQRQAELYTRWSYLASIAYLGVLAIWIVAMRDGFELMRVHHRKRQRSAAQG